MLCLPKLDIITFLHVLCPQGKVVSQELHDQSTFLVAFLIEGIQLGHSVIKGLFGKAATSEVGCWNTLLKLGGQDTFLGPSKSRSKRH